MTIDSFAETGLAAKSFDKFYNETHQKKISTLRKQTPPHLLEIPRTEEPYKIWESVKANFLQQTNCSNNTAIRRGITSLKLHVNICFLARLFRNHSMKLKKTMDARNSLHKKVVGRVSKCRYCSYDSVKGSQHLRTIGIITDNIETSETAAIFLRYSARMDPMDQVPVDELQSIMRELTELKEETDKEDVEDMCEAYIIIIENYITYKKIREMWWETQDLVENDIYLRLIHDKPILHEFSKVHPLRQVLSAHQQLIILKDTADFIPEMRILIEATELNFFSTEIQRLNTIFTNLGGFRKSDIQNIINQTKTLRTRAKQGSALKRELFEVQKNIYKLFNLFEEPKKTTVSVTPSVTKSPETSFLPKNHQILRKPKQAARRGKKSKSRSRTRRRYTHTTTTSKQQHSVASYSLASSTIRKSQKIITTIKSKPPIWTKNVPTYPFPHHLTWDRRIARWYHKEPACLEEGSYKDLSQQQKTLEHHCHSLPPCLDTFLNSDYAVRSVWKSGDGEESDEMYSIPSAIEYKDPHSGEGVLEFGHTCAVVNTRRKVIYHRYFHRSERQTFYRTGLTKEALVDIWKGQKQLPKISTKTSGCSTLPRNNRPKEDVQKLFNRLTKSIIIVDKLHGLKVTLFKPSE